MADDRSLVEVQLVSDAAAVPAPDMLLAGPLSSSYADVLHVVSEGELKRGTVLMSMAGSDDFTLCTQSGLTAAQAYAILAEDINTAKFLLQNGADFNKTFALSQLIDHYRSCQHCSGKSKMLDFAVSYLQKHPLSIERRKHEH